MAISFTNDRYFRTDFTSAFWQNVPRASQWFKILITSATPNLIVGEEFLGKTGQVCITEQFAPVNSASFVYGVFTLTGGAPAQSCQRIIPITIGAVYGIAVTWDGVARRQILWVNGIPANFSGGTIAGNISNLPNPLQFGINGVASTHVVFELDDHCMWQNYVLTADDLTALLRGDDPTTIGASSTRRCRWTLAGTTGASPVIGDAGLKNAYGGGAARPAGDGSDCILSGGAGSAVYKPGLVWVPSVAVAPYVASSGKVIIFYPFTTLVDGAITKPDQVTHTPTLTVNGTDLGPLEKSWFPGTMPFLFYATPGNFQIQPGDTVTLNAPAAWCGTPAGSVEAMVNKPADNRSGRSSVGSDTAIKTMPMAVGMNDFPMLYDFAFYQPFANWKYLIGNGGRGKITANYSQPLLSLNGVNQLDNTGNPSISGLWLVMWDVANTAAPSNAYLNTANPSYTSCVERVDLRQRPASGIGYASVFDLQNIPGNRGGIGGSYCADTSVQFNITDPSGHPDRNYSNLAIVAPGDWDLVAGVPVFDRTDPFALSRRFLHRMPPNVPMLRWLSSGPVGGNPTAMPYPEVLQSKTDETFGHFSGVVKRFGYSSFYPVDMVATPWVYSPFLGRPNARGETFTATLATAITTAPAVGTQETWTVSDGATAPLMAGLEMKIDAEVVRIISGAGTSWVVYRGSNGTTPATHAAGPLVVFGRIEITRVLNGATGLYPSALIIGATTATPHGLTAGNSMDAVGCPNLTFTTGEVAPWVGGYVFATGPNTLFQIQFGRSKFASGGKPIQTYTVNPATTFAQTVYPHSGGGIPHEVEAIITGKFAECDMWANLWMDASDDMVYTVARQILANLPAGRRVFVELDNEPWNFGFSGYYYHSLMGQLVMPNWPGGIMHYCYRALQVHKIFSDVFTAAGRGSEVVGVLNSIQGGAELPLYFAYSQTVGIPIGCIAYAPYFGTQNTALNAHYVNTIDDEQMIDMAVHDLWYNPNQLGPVTQATQTQIAAYNAATGNHCFLTAYECDLAGLTAIGALSGPTPITNEYARNRDGLTHPNIYMAEQDYYYWLQTQGYQQPAISVFSLAWGAYSRGWQIYHGPDQDYGRGDGSDGKLNNMLCRANPTSPHYKGANVNQDANTVSVKGKAWFDWMAAVAGTPPPVATGYSLTPPVPASGPINTASGNFTVQPNGPYTGTITITPSGGGLSTPIVLTWASSSAAQTFTITPTSTGNVTLTPTNSGSLTDPSPVTYTITSATAYIFTAPSPPSGLIGVASGLFTVQPNGPYIGTITVTPTGGGLTVPIVLTWANTGEAQTFSILPTLPGTVTLTPTNSGGLADQGAQTYTATAPPPGVTRTPWLGSWFARWFAAGPAVSSAGRPGASASATGGVGQGGAAVVSFHDVDAPRLRHGFAPWPRRGNRPRGR